MRSKKLKIITRYSLLTTRSKGQTLIEFVLIAIISIALIFGVMDLARLSWTMFHLHGAAFAAARAEAVRKSGFTAANYVTMRTLGGHCLVSVNKSHEVPSHNPPWTVPGVALKKDDVRIYAINATVTYLYRPLFAAGAFKTGVIPLKVSSRMQTEIPNPIPQSRN
ncbi:MAG: pilus assembly protein [Elusimicrobia bacterium]|nr:pilus assembly protein [Elusimicrobiota bacterium]